MYRCTNITNSLWKTYRIRVMMFKATFNNIVQLYRGGQFYWWRKLEYLEKITVVSHWQTLSHYVESSTLCHEQDSNLLTTLVLTGTVSIGSCKSNYHMVTTMTAPRKTVNNNVCSRKHQNWWLMVFNATFKNISFILWRLVLLVEEETRVPLGKPLTCYITNPLDNH